MDTEVGGNLLESHTVFTILSDANNVVTELLGIGPRAQQHPSRPPRQGKPDQMSPTRASAPVPASMSACTARLRTVSLPSPRRRPTWSQQAVSDAYSPRCSATIRSARSLTAGSIFFGTQPSSSTRKGGGGKPGAVQRAICRSAVHAALSLDSSSTAIPCVRNAPLRSEEHTSELQSRGHLVCRLL